MCPARTVFPGSQRVTAAFEGSAGGGRSSPWEARMGCRRSAVDVAGFAIRAAWASLRSMLSNKLSLILFASAALVAPACTGDDTDTGGSSATAGSTGSNTSTSGASTSTTGASTGDTGTASGDTGTASGDTGTGGTTGGAGACEAFCADFIATCGDTVNNYGTEAECVTACEGMMQDQVDCRVMHLGLAKNDAAMHCPHADLDGGGVCK